LSSPTPPPTLISPLSLHDALPISGERALPRLLRAAVRALRALVLDRGVFLGGRLRPGQRLRAGPVVDGGRARLALQRDVPGHHRHRGPVRRRALRLRHSVPQDRCRLRHRPHRALRHRRGTRPDRGDLQRAGRRDAPCPRSAALALAGALAAARAAGARHSGRDRRRRPRRRRGDGVVVRLLQPGEDDLAEAGAVQVRPRRWRRRLGKLGQRLDGWRDDPPAHPRHSRQRGHRGHDGRVPAPRHPARAAPLHAADGRGLHDRGRDDPGQRRHDRARLPGRALLRHADEGPAADPQHLHRRLLLPGCVRAPQRSRRRLADDALRRPRLLHATVRFAHPAAGDGHHPRPDGGAVLPHVDGGPCQRRQRFRHAPGARRAARHLGPVRALAGRQAASPAVTAGVRDMTLAFAATLMGLGLGGAFVAGLLGVGGAIIMIPLLLYVPPLVDVGKLSVKAVAGVTMVQVLVAATSGMLAHRRHRAVNAELAWVGGVAMASGSLVGALGSYYVYDRWLLLIFALMVTAAGALMIVPVEAAAPSLPIGEPRRFSRPLTATVCGSVGVGAGLVGAGGAFLLVPLLLVVVGVPIRVTIGSSLAITALSSSMGVVGKLVTDQIPYESALVVAIGAVPGAQLGAALSRRLSGSQLKLALGLIIAVIAIRVWWDVLTYH